MGDETIIGLEDLLKDLEQLPRTMQKTMIVRALRKGSQPIKTAIERLAPDDPTTPGSRIRNNIDVNVTDQTSEGATALIGPTRKGFVARFAEKGTKHQKARPFIGPAFDQTIEAAVKLVSDELGESIENELKK